MSTRSLDAWLEYISQTHPNSIELGLDRISTVMNLMGVTKNSKVCVVVAGTNGKGSTIALIEAAMLALGFSVGSYTSPHISNYNERVKLDAKPVSDNLLIKSFESIERVRGDIPLTYFEFGTLAALDILFSQSLDAVLLEVGLGGRLDAVNVINGDVTVITSIALDHTEWLGEDLELIGTEKAGILRQNTTFFAGENLPQSVYVIAAELNCNTKVFNQDFGLVGSKGCIENGENEIGVKGGNENYFEFDLRENSINPQLLPNIQLPSNNICLALQVTAYLHGFLNSNTVIDFPFSLIKSSMESVSIPGRLEKINHSSAIYLDVGHNPHAALYLKGFLSDFEPNNVQVNVVYSALADKNIAEIVAVLSSVVDTWFVASMKVDRAISLDELESIVGGRSKNMLSFASVDKAICAAVDQSEKSQSEAVVTLIFGSFFMVEAAKKYFEGL